ncbi:MAG: hypothetical protein JW741_15715 [Sedimentisphaerales bacterium]|nr:hypothetical protein [Sedimentisphaerales bacterium]
MWRCIAVCVFVNAMVVAECSSKTLETQSKAAGRQARAGASNGPQTVSSLVTYQQRKYALYPRHLDKRPDIPSPYAAEDGTEIVTALMKNGQYALLPVTVENGSPLLYSVRVPTLYGKDRQLPADHGDFPALAKTGLHCEAELDNKETITGMSVDVITYIGRPGRFSGAGFMADDEDIISVLKGDNDLVRRLGLTHPQMAKPLFHMWNMILKEIECGRFGRFSGVQAFFYNGKKVLFKAESMKGWQRSIFQDEVKGRFDIDVRCDLTAQERAFLKENYAHLSDLEMAEFEESLTRFHFSEMVPYYITRYGFYEGHTDYRADPVAITRIFNLKTIQQIETTFPTNLHKTLKNHFTKK